jgi:spermidine synthase
LMNMTFSWRAYASNLLSKEFMTMCKNSLKENGVFYFNPTGYEGSFKTTAHVFKYVTKFSNFIAASQQSFSMTENEKERALMGFIDDNGNPYFMSAKRRRAFSALKSNSFPELGDKYRKITHLKITTDDNMAPEYNYVDFDENRHWKKIVARIFNKNTNT